MPIILISLISTFTYNHVNSRFSAVTAANMRSAIGLQIKKQTEGETGVKVLKEIVILYISVVIM